MFHAVLRMLSVIHRRANRLKCVIHRLFHYAVLRFPHYPQFSDYFPNALRTVAGTVYSRLSVLCGATSMTVATHAREQE